MNYVKIFLMKQVDLSKKIRGYKSGWIALSPNYYKVVGFGKTIESTLEQASKKRVNKPILMKASKSYAPIAPCETSLS